jgi:hypothetical protein
MNGNSLKKIVSGLAAGSVSETRRGISFLRTHALTEAGLVTVFLLLFAGSAIFLDTKIGRDLDPDIRKEWWTVSFETRDPSDLSFAIENHSGKTGFSYLVTRDKIIIDGGTVSVAGGERKIVFPSGTGDTAGRTLIIVESEDGSKKSVYRER